MSGTYAEPGSQSYRAELARDRDVARCRYCGADIYLHTSHGGPTEWRHAETDDARCEPEGSRLDGVA